MMNLTTATNHASAYDWASALLAHGFIGFALVAALAWAIERVAGDWIDAAPALAMWIVAGGYLALWEVGVQGLGAGVADALVDTFAVFAGCVAGVAAWSRRGAVLAAVLALMAWVLARGVRARR